MAKDKKRKTGKAPKATRLPKTIAGVAIPKTLRSEGGALIDLLRHPAIAGLAAAGLAALTDAIRDGGTPRAADTPDKTSRTAIDFGQGAAIIGTMIAARLAEGGTRKA